MKLLSTLNPEHASTDEYKEYLIREASRAVIIDEVKHVALLYVAKDQSYKLPGGGIEEGETPEEALARECLEEVGCQIEILDEIGKIIEFRKFCNLKQTSYCYFAKLKGAKGLPHFAEDEVRDGFQNMWLPLDIALNRLSENKSVSLEGKQYIVPRDSIILKAAKEKILSFSNDKG